MAPRGGSEHRNGLTLMHAQLATLDQPDWDPCPPYEHCHTVSSVYSTGQMVCFYETKRSQVYREIDNEDDLV